MAGLKQTIFKGMIENFRCEDAEKYLCVDNDSAGLNFIASVKSEYPNVKMLTPIGEHKDQNDQLKDIKTHNTNNLNEWRIKMEAEKGDNISKNIESNKHYEQIEKI